MTPNFPYASYSLVSTYHCIAGLLQSVQTLELARDKFEDAVKKFPNYVDGLVLYALVSVKPQRRVDTTLHGQQLVSLQDAPRANIVDAIYNKYCMNEATPSIASLFFFKLTSRDSCSWSTIYVHLYFSSSCLVSFLIFPCSPLHPGNRGQCLCMFSVAPGQQDRRVCMYPLAPRPARPVCVYVPPCITAGKTSVCVCSTLHPGK